MEKLKSNSSKANYNSFKIRTWLKWMKSYRQLNLFLALGTEWLPIFSHMVSKGYIMTNAMMD